MEVLGIRIDDLSCFKVNGMAVVIEMYLLKCTCHLWLISNVQLSYFLIVSLTLRCKMRYINSSQFIWSTHPHMSFFGSLWLKAASGWSRASIQDSCYVSCIFLQAFHWHLLYTVGPSFADLPVVPRHCVATTDDCSGGIFYLEPSPDNRKLSRLPWRGFVHRCGPPQGRQ